MPASNKLERKIMSGIYRRMKPKLKLGKENKRNRIARSRKYENIETGVLIVDKEESGYGYKHLLDKEEIMKFVEIIPEWEKLSEGLNVILLARGSDYSDGWHSRGKIAIRAWEKDLWKEVSVNYFNEHKMVFDKLEVKYKTKDDGYVLCFTENKAKAFQLLHIFMHELGHHYDRMTTKYKASSCRGELFAEQYANNHLASLWELYIQKFPTN
jgi:hypothetical protein